MINYLLTFVAGAMFGGAVGIAALAMLQMAHDDDDCEVDRC